MIELIKEKVYSTKDGKIQSVCAKKVNLFDKFRPLKFTSSVVSSRPREYETFIYIGLSNGNILCLNISKQKSVN
jgi:hypothetical protein